MPSSTTATRATPDLTASVKALTFDVFGTVVDWRSSIIREGEAVGRAKGLTHVDWAAFADAWRAGYKPAMARVRSGELPWMNIDQLHRMILDELLARKTVAGRPPDLGDDLAWVRAASGRGPEHPDPRLPLIG